MLYVEKLEAMPNVTTNITDSRKSLSMVSLRSVAAKQA